MQFNEIYQKAQSAGFDAALKVVSLEDFTYAVNKDIRSTNARIKELSKSRGVNVDLQAEVVLA